MTAASIQTPVRRGAALELPIAVVVVRADATEADPAANPNANPTTVYTAQQTVTASAAALPAQALVNGIVIKAKSANTGTTYVGPSSLTTANGYALLPGEAISFGVTNASAIWIIGAAADVVYVAGN